MISVPLSIVATFIGLSVMDFSLNLITLLALCLMIGNLATMRLLFSLSLAALLLVLSIAMFPLGYIGFEMMADGDNNEVDVSIEFVKDISISQNNEITREIESEILAIPEVASVYAGVGASGSQSSGGDAFKSSFGIKLTDRKQRKRSSEEFASYVERYINANFPGVKATAAAAGLVGAISLSQARWQTPFPGLTECAI